MKKFILDTLLKPFFAIVFFLLFGIPFVFAGFQTVHITGTKSAEDVVTIDFTRTHFWGLYRTTRHLEGVTEVTLESRTSDRTNTRPMTTVSGVFLVTATQSESLFSFFSNTDDSLKSEAMDSLNGFLTDPQQRTYDQTFAMRNIFGWCGLPFLIIGLLGLFGWPGTIFKALRS
ncbi:MAG: hypothetical protein HUU38_04380 [Anaerolineales bacterium]|nr:hypothetical protein [Anaerolineales bacterium]